MDLNFLENLNFYDKLVFVRNDFNVPLNDKGEILDDTRIRESLPTLEYLIKQGAKIVCASHLGRPEGEKKLEFSLKPVAERLSTLLDLPVVFTGETIGNQVEQAKTGLKKGEILLLENLRFYRGETDNDKEYARELAKGIDIYINNAFGASHRNHASVVRMTEFIPVSAAGMLLKKEMDYLSLAVKETGDDYILILGGAKVSDKIPVINNLIEKVGTILIGGAMAYTFLKTKGIKVGKSLVEDDYIPMCSKILKKAEARNVEVMLPFDHIAAIKVEPNVTIRMISRGEDIPEEMMGLDIGMETVNAFTKEIQKARLIVWNGTMGVFEIDDFSAGTLEIARAISKSSATSIVGGGDSVSALHKAGVAHDISHISTGGGASLEFLSGKTLPGIASLRSK